MFSRNKQTLFGVVFSALNKRFVTKKGTGGMSWLKTNRCAVVETLLVERKVGCRGAVIL